MKYTKQNGVSGKWAKAAELKTGTRAKIVSETVPMTSQFEDKEGKPKMQDVAKVRFEGNADTMNVSLNRATLNGLIDAFGDDSKEWINKYLTVHTEKVAVGGKRVTALYLVPENFSVSEDDNGYIVIQKVELTSDGKPVPDFSQVDTIQPVEEIDPNDIPF
jgi:hypothetical protein